jgi:hypothetical protein
MIRNGTETKRNGVKDVRKIEMGSERLRVQADRETRERERVGGGGSKNSTEADRRRNRQRVRSGKRWLDKRDTLKERERGLKKKLKLVRTPLNTNKLT